MNRYFGTLTLTKFALMRDRIWLALWVIGIALFVAICAPLFPEMAKTPAALQAFSETMKNPAMVAMTGPVYAEPYTYGILYTQMMSAWILILIGAMNFFLVARHTRSDEETGRIEVIRSLPVGRSAVLASTWTVTVLANLGLSLLSAVSLILTNTESMDDAGCFVLGGIFFCGGLLFAAIAMLCAQLCVTSRGVIGCSFVVLGVLYGIGAFGNIGGGAAASVSVFSFVFKTAPFAGDHVWPLFVLLAEALVIAIIAVRLNTTRDMGGGFLPQRNGRAHAKASLSSPLGFAFRLTKNFNIAWIIIMFVVGAMYGSIFGDFESFIKNSDLFRAMIQADVDAGANEMLSFMTYITLVTSLITAIPVINIVLRIRGEEKRNRIEAIYAKSVSKMNYLMSYVGIALVVSVLLQLAQGFGLWLSASAVMSEPFALLDVLAAGLIRLPGIWLLSGIGVLLLGLLPRLTSLVWIYFGFSFFVMYFGKIKKMPDIVTDLSAFGALPDCPIEKFAPAPVALITAFAAVVMFIGAIAYARREVRYR